VLAALKINLDAEQQPQFRDTVRVFLEGIGSDVQRLLGRANQTGLPRKIRSKRRSRVKQMDKQMADFLSPEQLPMYEVYRDTLLNQMDESAANRRGI
jgi:hypothetical protein